MICVRGNRPPATKLSITSASNVTGQSITGASITVRVQDAAGNNVNAGGRTISISSTSLGTLGGTLTAVTNYSGIATFSAFTLDTVGSAVLTISSPGVTSATKTIEVRAGITAGQNICLLDNSRFITQNGGCHDTMINLVWGTISSATYTWHQAIWDSALAGNNAPDIYDGGKVNDYDPAWSNAGGLDSSLIDYCHDLVEGGYSDWRLPRYDDVVNGGAGGAAGNSLSSSHVGVYFWLSSVVNANDARVGYFSSSTFSSSWTGKANKNKVICVRDP